MTIGNVNDARNLRLATPDDSRSLSVLDALCFPPGDGSREPAAPGEFEDGLRSGEILVIDDGGDLVGFVQWSASDSIGGYFLSAVAVHPDHRRQGLAEQLLRGALDRINGSLAAVVARVSTVTAPSNIAMIRCLTTCGFVGNLFLANYFGPGRHRIHFDYQPTDSYTALSDVAFVPVEAQGLLESLLSGEDKQLVGVVHLPHGEHLRVSRRVDLDQGAALGNEVSVGSSFAGTMLASLIFLFGFALVDQDVSGDLVAAVGGSVLLTTLSLLSYANASGELTRVRGGAIHEYMRLGNLWSEFGAVFPLFLLMPAIVVVATEGSLAGVVIAVVASVLVGLYQLSPICLAGRFESHRSAWMALGVALTAMPVLSAVTFLLLGTTWPWTVVFIALTMVALALGTYRSE